MGSNTPAPANSSLTADNPNDKVLAQILAKMEAQDKHIAQLKNDKAKAQKDWVEGPRAHLFGIMGIYNKTAAELSDKADSSDDPNEALVLRVLAFLEERLVPQFWVNKVKNDAALAAKQAAQRNGNGNGATADAPPASLDLGSLIGSALTAFLAKNSA